MIKLQSKKWKNTLNDYFVDLCKSEKINFCNLKPSNVPKKEGVYLITENQRRSIEIPLYIGRTKNLKQRLYNNHLMGPLANARLKKYLINSGTCNNILEAKKFIKEKCSVRWIYISESRIRGAVEAYLTGHIFPKFGIEDEH